MFDVIISIIGAVGSEYTEIILQICGSCIVILTASFIDLIYRVFRHFWR